MDSQGYTSKNLDHLGLVAGMCAEIGIGELIDRLCPSDSPDQIVSTGKALEAMILNGLGFVNKRLYLIPHFFADKPLELLLGPGIEASHLNDDRLGRALDQFYESGLTALFAQISAQTLSVLGYHPQRGHLDSTSLSVYGKYNSDQQQSDTVHITHGYSKDHRPDLPQVSLQLICEHLSGIPMHMEVLNGNSNDSESFRQTIQSFGKQLYHQKGLRTIVADSKLYSQETLGVLQESGLSWVSRVPGTLQAIKDLLANIKAEDLSQLSLEGYQSQCYTLEYGGVDQHWVVYHSQKAMEREKRTMERRRAKEAEKALKSLGQLASQHFHCQEDALIAAQNWQKSWKWHHLDKIEPVQHKTYEKPGRPSAKDIPKIHYQIQAQLTIDQRQWDRILFQRSMFVLATNQKLDYLEDQEELLETYKEQHSVERGFRFIKDPQIVASSFFVQKPQRVAALLFVMTTCLLVYSALEYRIRQALAQNEHKVPDQKGKPTQKPTARWIFQLFTGIHTLVINQNQTIILNLNQVHRDLIALLSYAKFYS